MTSSQRRQIDLRLTTVAAVLVLVVITWLRINSINHLPDQGFFAKYTEIAESILSGYVPHDRLGDLSTGYLWTVVVCTGPLGMNVVALRTAQIIGVSLAALICGAAAWRRWGFFAGLVSTSVLLVSRAALVNACEIEPETMILVLTSIGLSLLLTSDHPVSRTFAGSFFGLAVVTRPSVLLPVVLTLIVLAWKAGPRKRLAAVVPLILGVALPVFAARVTYISTVGAPPAPMNPGTVLFEGWNPLTTGYLGEAPAVVKDVEQSLGLPDGLHVAYRLVASRATGQPMSAASANAYWARRALAFVTNEPSAAFSLGLRKLVLGLHSYDAWDLKTLQRKSALLSGKPFVGFGFLVGIAAIGLVLGRSQPGTWILGVWVLGGWTVMVLFYVSARQRNVLLPAVALLAGVAFNSLAKSWNAGARPAVVIAVAAASVSGCLLSLDGAAQHEDRHGWFLLDAQEFAAHQASRTREETERSAWLARGASFLDQQALRTADPQTVAREVRVQLAQPQSHQRYFDLALVMIEIGRCLEAEGLLVSLDGSGYQPRRGARWCSSTAYQLARCRITSSGPSGVQDLMKKALLQAPGDPRVLALHAVIYESVNVSLPDTSSRKALAEIFDPFTATRALATANFDIGRNSVAEGLTGKIRQTLPEWTTPARR